MPRRRGWGSNAAGWERGDGDAGGGEAGTQVRRRGGNAGEAGGGEAGTQAGRERRRAGGVGMQAVPEPA